YFRRLGKGNFRKAPEEIVKAALIGIERKKQQAAQIDAWASELMAGQCPGPVREQLYKILFKPDKNGAEYKAVVEAAKRSQKAPPTLPGRSRGSSAKLRCRCPPPRPAWSRCRSSPICATTSSTASSPMPR